MKTLQRLVTVLALATMVAGYGYAQGTVPAPDFSYSGPYPAPPSGEPHEETGQLSVQAANGYVTGHIDWRCGGCPWFQDTITEDFAATWDGEKFVGTADVSYYFFDSWDDNGEIVCSQTAQWSGAIDFTLYTCYISLYHLLVVGFPGPGVDFPITIYGTRKISMSPWVCTNSWLKEDLYLPGIMWGWGLEIPVILTVTNFAAGGNEAWWGTLPPEMGQYYVWITVHNSGDQAQPATIELLAEDNPTFGMTPDSIWPSSITKNVPAQRDAVFQFTVAQRWDWIPPPEPVWQAVLKGAVSCVPATLIEEWASAIRGAGALGSWESIRDFYHIVEGFLKLYEVRSALMHDEVEVRFFLGPGTTEWLTFPLADFADPRRVTVRVSNQKKDAFAIATTEYAVGHIFSLVGSKAGLAGLPLLAAEVLAICDSRGYYRRAYDPDPDYTTIPVIQPLDYPELDALPDSPGKAVALAAKAWSEIETARTQAWVRMAAAEDAGDDYWRLRQAQAAEELGQIAGAKIADYLRLLTAVPGLQSGGTPEEVASFKQQLLAEGLPEIETAFLLRQGWTTAEIADLVQNMVDLPDEIYTTPGLQADLSLLVAAGAWVDTAEAAAIVDSSQSGLGLPATQIVPSGTLARDGQFVSDVMVLLNSVTPTSVAVAAVDYSLDEGVNWISYTGPFTISDDGTTTILARTTDSLEQVEDPPARRVVSKRDSMFNDVPVDSWAWAQIEAAYWSGIVQGYPDGTYQPNNPVTRDQMAVYIARAVAGGEGSIPTGPAVSTFLDIPADQWAFDHIEYCQAQGIVEGYPDGNYQPAISVTRDQMAVYIARSTVAPTGEAALADYTPADPRNFPDVPSDFWAWKHVEYCVENGVVQGYDDGLYHPEVVVTRDQMAVYVARAFQLPM